MRNCVSGMSLLKTAASGLAAALSLLPSASEMATQNYTCKGSPWTTTLENRDSVEIEKPILCDGAAESSDPEKPGFLSPPDDAVTYHGFPLLSDMCSDGYCYGAITDFLHFDSEDGCTIGDGFVEAPNGSRAGITWEVHSQAKYSVIDDPDESRWGVYYFTIKHPVTTREDMRQVFVNMVPKLKSLHEQAGLARDKPSN